MAIAAGFVRIHRAGVLDSNTIIAFGLGVLFVLVGFISACCTFGSTIYRDSRLVEEWIRAFGLRFSSQRHEINDDHSVHSHPYWVQHSPGGDPRCRYKVVVSNGSGGPIEIIDDLDESESAACARAVSELLRIPHLSNTDAP